jgi:hypothetical protein
MTRELPTIKDKFDTEGAGDLVLIGYPENKSALSELIFWSCFPNDPVCHVTHPYVASLRDEVLAPALAEFLDFHLDAKQLDLVSDAFWLFINERGESFRTAIASLCLNINTKALFKATEYSLAQFQEDRLKFEEIRRQQPNSGE